MGREGGRIGAEFDRRAATYDTSAMHRWQAREAVRLAAPRPRTWVLDVATGQGWPRGGPPR